MRNRAGKRDHRTRRRQRAAVLVYSTSKTKAPKVAKETTAEVNKRTKAKPNIKSDPKPIEKFENAKVSDFTDQIS